jgi:hypothetical protein
MAPESAYQDFTPPPGGVWPNAQVYGTDIYVPWNTTDLDTKETLLAGASPKRYYCYGLAPALSSDTKDEFTVSKDPEDPIFYSTCWYKFDGNTFEDYIGQDKHDPQVGSFRFNTKCIDCASRTINSDIDILLPEWTVPDTCVDCDKEPSDAVAATFTAPILIEQGVRCDGVGGTFSRVAHHNCSEIDAQNCVKQLFVVGRPVTQNVTLQECREMANRDPQCSNIFAFKNTSPYKCFCYTNLTCCKTCSRAPNIAADTYEIASVSDPTCATGTLSADGLSCCSGSCGAGKCVNNAELLTQAGFCCSTCITRSCSEYGPPCML